MKKLIIIIILLLGMTRSNAQFIDNNLDCTVVVSMYCYSIANCAPTLGPAMWTVTAPPRTSMVPHPGTNCGLTGGFFRVYEVTIINTVTSCWMGPFLVTDGTNFPSCTTFSTQNAIPNSPPNCGCEIPASHGMISTINRTYPGTDVYIQP